MKEYHVNMKKRLCMDVGCGYKINVLRVHTKKRLCMDVGCGYEINVLRVPAGGRYSGCAADGVCASARPAT